MAAFLVVLNPIANVILIPLHHQNGAALVTSATEAIVLVWVLAATPRDLRSAARPMVVVKVVLAATVAAGSLWLLRDWSLFVSLPIAGVLYLILALTLGIIPIEELRSIPDRFRARGRRGGPPVVAIGEGAPAASQSRGA